MHNNDLNEFVKIGKELHDLGLFCRQNKPLVRHLKQATNFLPEKARVRQRLWHIEHKVDSIPKCKTCDENPVRWRDHTRKYPPYCSSKCANKDPNFIQKRKNAYLDRYGVDHPWKSNTIRQNIEKTMKDKYKGGRACEKIQEKRRDTINTKYEDGFKSEKIQEKRQNTMLKKYGVKHASQNPKIKNKIKQTNLKRYGCEVSSQNSAVKQKKRQTLLDRYGVDNFSQAHIDTNLLEKLNNKDWLIKQHHVNQKSLSQIALQCGVSVHCLICRFRDFDIKVYRWGGSSTFNDGVYNFIEERYNGNIVQNDRNIISPYEIDLYLPDINIAFECNGIYWHSELVGKDRNYHLNKSTLCSEKNIRLIHILENEWIKKTEIVKSRIGSLLKLNQTLYARKCTIEPLTNIQQTSFFNKNHIQGSAQSSISFGLIYNEEIVAAISFSKSRFNKKVEYELLRFCNKLNTNIVGGASKLFTHFIKKYNPTSIISYSDKRWNSGNVYQQLGFHYKHDSKPNYFYFKNSNALLLESRQKYQKHKLPKLLETFDVKQTEWENMQNNGYNRIWDCGNSVWIWKK